MFSTIAYFTDSIPCQLNITSFFSSAVIVRCIHTYVHILSTDQERILAYSAYHTCRIVPLMGYHTSQKCFKKKTFFYSYFVSLFFISFHMNKCITYPTKKINFDHKLRMYLHESLQIHQFNCIYYD